MNLRAEFQTFAKQLERDDEAAMSLWTWLPSYKAAKLAHGGYSDEHQPPISEIMDEASALFSWLKHGDIVKKGDTPREGPFDANRPIHYCPCDDPECEESWEYVLRVREKIQKGDLWIKGETDA